MPDSYETVLGKEFKGGVELSGGQWQRMAMARVLYKSSSLLILDEPTSFVDGYSEKSFLNQLRKEASDKMVIIISHKISNIKITDKIVVLHKGRLVEQGNHDQLMSMDSYYKKMFASQLVNDLS